MYFYKYKTETNPAWEKDYIEKRLILQRMHYKLKMRID